MRSLKALATVLVLASGLSAQFTGNARRIQGVAIKSPLACTDGYVLTYVAANLRFECLVGGGGGAPAFSSVTAGTNAAALVMGTGGSLTVSGSGTINATSLGGDASALIARLASPTFTGTVTIGTTLLTSNTSLLGPGESVLNPAVSGFVTPATSLITSLGTAGNMPFTGLGVEADFVASGFGIGIWDAVIGSGIVQGIESDLIVSGNASSGTGLVINTTVAPNSAVDTVIGIDVGFGALPGTSSLSISEGIHIFHREATGQAHGLVIDDISGAASNLAIVTGLGDVVFGTLKTTGAATGKKIVCVDTATGQLYASSSGVACAN